MNKIKVLLLTGGGASEHKISLSSAEQVLKYLDKDKYELIKMVLRKGDNLDIKKIREINPDVVFIVIHGGVGEDGTIQRILEKENIRFVGCGSEASRIGMNKLEFKKIMKINNLNVAKHVEINLGDNVDIEKMKKMGDKWVVKPVGQGSSIGVSLVKDINKLKGALDEAFKYDTKVLVEEFIEGVEISCGVMEVDGELKVLPVAEICSTNDFFDFDAKYTEGKSMEIIPARLSDKVTKTVLDQAAKIFKIIGGRGFSRIDFIVRNGELVILEINTIPGLTPMSILPKEAKVLGMDYKDLLDKMIESALN